MADEVKKEVVEGTQPNNVEQQPTQVNVEEIKSKTKTEVLRELSKELGVNVFEAEGLQQVKSLIESQKTEAEKLVAERDTLIKERESWQNEKRLYEGKLKATELGIKSDSLEDALKLAGNDPNNLEEVVKKYPFFTQKDGVKIGMTTPPNQTPPNSNSDAEAYMADKPLYKNYRKK